MIPTQTRPAGELGTVCVAYFGARDDAIRGPSGVVYLRAFGRWYGYAASHRISRSFRPAVTP